AAMLVPTPLVHRFADGGPTPADELSLDDHGIDDPTAVVDDDIAQDAHAAGLDIHLDLDGMAPAAIGERARQEALHVLEPRLESAGHGIAGHPGYRFGNLTQREPAARCASNLDAAIAQLEVADTDLQKMGADLERFFPHLARAQIP